jgi:integrase
MVNTRTWIRGLKKIDFKEDDALREHVGLLFPNMDFPSGITAVERAATLLTLDDKVTPAVLRELYGFLPDELLGAIGPNAAKNRLVPIRKAVQERFSNDVFDTQKMLNKLTLPKEVYKEVKAAYNAKLLEENRKPISVPAAEVNKIVRDLIPARNVIDMAILLQLTSGVRISELQTSEFEGIDKKPQWLRQKGISKIKGGADVVVDKPVVFLANANIWLQKQREFKNKVAGKDITMQVNRRIKNLFAEESFSSHDLRKLYVDLSWNEFGSKQDPRPSQAAWAAQVLGHDESLASAASYTTRQVVGEVAGDVQQPAAVDIPRNTKARDGKQMERIAATAAALKANGIKVTTRELIKLGYGSRVAGAYLKGLKE